MSRFTYKVLPHAFVCERFLLHLFPDRIHDLGIFAPTRKQRNRHSDDISIFRLQVRGVDQCDRFKEVFSRCCSLGEFLSTEAKTVCLYSTSADVSILRHAGLHTPTDVFPSFFSCSTTDSRSGFTISHDPIL